MEKLLVEFARHADRNRFDLRFICLGKRGSVADEIEACGWPVTALDEATLAAYEAPWPVRESKAGVAAFPLLVPLRREDPNASALRRG